MFHKIKVFVLLLKDETKKSQHSDGRWAVPTLTKKEKKRQEVKNSLL